MSEEKRLLDLWELNLRLLETLEGIGTTLIKFSEENNMSLPQNLYYLICEAQKLIKEISGSVALEVCVAWGCCKIG